MKQFRHILILLLAGFVGFSCSDEQLPSHASSSWQGNEQIQLTLTAADEIRSGETKAVDGTVEEGTNGGYQISDFVLFQFDEQGKRLVDPQYYTYTPSQTIPVVLPTGEQEYTIVALANTHDPLAPFYFADANTLDALMGKYKSVQKLTDTYQQQASSYDLLMNGWTTIDKNTQSINLTLYRNVAKLTLTINNSASSGITIKTAQVKSVPTKIDYFYQLIADQKSGSLAAPYPNPNTFRNFDYEVDQFDVVEGENKTLTYYLPCHLMGTSNSTSENTKGNYAPDYATFVELYAEKNDGSKCARYRIYLGDNKTNDYNIRPNYHYDLPLTFNSLGNPQNDARVEFMDAVRTEPEANSYIVNPLPTDLQTLYNIPVYNRINTFWQNEKEAGYIPNATGYTIANEDKWAAAIIWQSSDQQLIEFYDDNERTGNEGRMSPTYKGQKPLRFKPKKGAKGNVLVGVYRTDQANANDPTKREYSWYWHLWITDYNPNDCVNQNWDGRYKLSVTKGEVHRYTGTLWDDENAIYHNKWIMDRFLGAFDNSGIDNQSYGLYYRFGTHLPYQGSFEKNYRYDSQTDTFISFDITNSSYIFKRYQHILYPTVWGKGSNEDYIADNQAYKDNIWNDPTWSINLQGGKTKKSFFDPCPPGWRIPEYKFLECKGTGGTHRTLIIYMDNVIGSDNQAVYPLNGGKESGTGHGWINQFTMVHSSTPSGYTVWTVLSQDTPYGYTWFNGSTHVGLRTTATAIRPIQYDEEADE